MSTLASHMSQMMADGRVTDGRIYGVQHNKKKAKRMGVQGVAGSKTGSGSNKPLVGKDAPNSNRTDKKDVQESLNLKATSKPKSDPAKPGKPKNISPLMRAFLAAKKSLATSTDSKAAAGGAKATKSPNAKTKGAGVD